MLAITAPSLLYRRPRVMNPLHALGLVKAYTQTNAKELACLARHARDKKLALEIGTSMGVSASVIARSLAPDGKLFCIDPWERRGASKNPSLSICERELKRKGVSDRIILICAYSSDAEAKMPSSIDFAFIDGDHSYEGLETDWTIVKRRLRPGGIVCLHDTSVPESEPYRTVGAVDFFEKVIAVDPEFEPLERCHSMNVVRRRLR